MYNYHMNGMDKFALNPKQSEAGFVVYHAVWRVEFSPSQQLITAHSFDADEILSIYSAGPFHIVIQKKVWQVSPNSVKSSIKV
jgi:hypothetical protein